MYSKTCVKRPFSKRPKIVFQDQLSLNAGQKYCRMLQAEHSAILSTFIELPFALRHLFCLFLSGRFTQVLLYSDPRNTRLPLFSWYLSTKAYVFHLKRLLWAFCNCFKKFSIYICLLIKPTNQNPHVFRPPDKSAYWKTIFLFLDQNICCGYSKEPSQ